MPDFMAPANILGMIAQGGGPYGPDWNAVNNNQRTAILQQKQQQEMEGVNALKWAYSDPSHYDPKTMQPTPEVMAGVMQRSPAAGMDLTNNLVALQQKRALLGNQQSTVMKHWRDRDLEIKKEAMDAYNGALDNGADPGKAQQIGQEVVSKGIEALKAEGLPQDMAQRINPNFDALRYRRDLLTPQQQDAATKEARKEAVPKMAVTMQSGGGQIEVPVIQDPKDPSGLKWVTADEEHKPVVDLTNLHPLRAAGSADKPMAPHIINAQTVDGKPVQMEQRAGGALFSVPGGERIDPATIKPGSMSTGNAQTTEDQAKATAEAIYEYRQPPLSSYSMRGGSGPAIMQALKEIGDERGHKYDAKDYSAAKTLLDGYSRTTPGSPGGQMQSVNNVAQHVEQLQKLATAMRNNDIPVANSVLNYVRTQLGHPEATNFDTAAQIVADEALKAVGAAGAVFDREKMLKNFSNAKAPDQIEGGINTIKSLMGGRVNSLRQQWQSLPGLNPDDFYAKLTPAAREDVDPYLPKKKEETKKEPSAAPHGDTIEPPPRPAAGSGTPPEASGGFGRVVGDSIGAGVGEAGKIPGKYSHNEKDRDNNDYDAVWGRTPRQVLNKIRNSDADAYKGQTVYLSSGASNDPSQINDVVDQVNILKVDGANVVLAGVGSGVKDYKKVNERLAQIAKDAGVPFTGELAGTQGGRVHPKSYEDAFKQAGPLALSAALPPEARSALKEGTQTQFRNGQVWTLKNGQPERVK